MSDVPRYPCLYCVLSFTTPNGLGLHTKHAHEWERNAAISTQRTRRAWDDEQLALLAEAEVRVKAEGYSGDINNVLASLFEGRTHHSIKQARKKISYLRMLLDAGGQDNFYAPDVSRRPVEPEIRTETVEGSAVALREAIGSLIEAISTSRTTLDTDRLMGIAAEAVAGSSVGPRLMQWIRAHLAVGAPLEAPVQPQVDTRPREQRARGHGRRRMAYAKLQKLWMTDRPAAAKEVISGGGPQVCHTTDELYQHWKPIIESPSAPWEAEEIRGMHAPAGHNLWTPITEREARRMCPSGSSSPGLDGVSPTVWKGLPWRTRAVILNLLLLEKRLPSELLLARVTMIPKNDRPGSPGDYRPISVASVVVRHLHRILASRLEAVIIHEPEQAGFRRGFDGVAYNVFLKDAVLRNAWSRRRSLCVAVLDVRRAFDSVSHSAILRMLKARGVQGEFCTYIQRVYEDGVSRICGNGVQSGDMKPKRGVRQGDPLSSVLFNMVMDHVIAGLSKRIGYRLGDARVRVLAYADDLILMSSSPEGLRALLDAAVEGLGDCGLELNPDKCRTLSLAPSVGGAQYKIETERIFRVGEHRIASVGPGDKWEYLGITFGTGGVVRESDDLTTGLERISRAPLKPQQKMEVLRTFFLPSLFQAMLFNETRGTVLAAADLSIRVCVRKWLRLPHDVSASLIHTPVRAGGLGIPRLASFLPYLREKRYKSVSDCLENAGLDDGVKDGLGGGFPHGVLPPNPRFHESQRLVSQVDGADLVGAAEVSASTSWISRTAHHLSGRDYVNAVRTYAGALPTRVRLTRGAGRRAGVDVKCRHGCPTHETNAHATQYCQRIRPGVTLRHHAVVRLIEASLIRSKHRVWKEATLTNPNTRQQLRPDLVVQAEGELIIIDVMIVGGKTNKDAAGHTKTAKYGKEWVYNEAAKLTPGRTTRRRVLPVVLSWKGIWSKKSAEALIKLGVTMRALSWITRRILIGSSMNFHRFMRPDPTETDPGQQEVRHRGVGRQRTPQHGQH